MYSHDAKKMTQGMCAFEKNQTASGSMEETSLPGGIVIFTKVLGTQESDQNQKSRVASTASKHFNAARQ